MTLEDYIDRLESLVKKLFENDHSGHEIWHLQRVYNNALAICEKEGGDKLIVGLSAYLHDIHRIMSNEEGKYVSPKDSLETVRRLLKYAGIEDEEIVEKVCFSIEHHEEYNWNANDPVDLNTQILQDADNLDAIGAIGIARTFQYGGSHGIPMYNPDKKINFKDNYQESDDLESCTIEHFYNKLFKLEDNMNTEAGKNLAKGRTDYMKGYVDEFMNEWYGFDRQRTK